MKESSHWMQVMDLHGLFTDGFLRDAAGNLLFGSFWGRDIAIREFQARITLGYDEDGLTGINAERGSHKVYIKLTGASGFEQQTGRVNTSLFGELINLWIYQRQLVEPDRANHRATLLCQSGEEVCPFEVIKAISPVPLLDHWRSPLLEQLSHAGMITHLRGFNVDAVDVALDESELAKLIRLGCHANTFT